jgi:hypothetical protein
MAFLTIFTLNLSKNLSGFQDPKLERNWKSEKIQPIMGLIITMFEFLFGNTRTTIPFKVQTQHKKFNSPFLSQLFDELTSKVNAFPVSSDNIEILETPQEFVEKLNVIPLHCYL